MRRDIDDAIRAVDELVKCTELSYPNRANIRGFLGAALIMNADPKKVPPHHIDVELMAHLTDALKPLGFRIVRRVPKQNRPDSCSRDDTPIEWLWRRRERTRIGRILAKSRSSHGRAEPGDHS